MPKLRTVVVIEFKNVENYEIEGCKVFPETATGNAEAEALFEEWVRSAQPAHADHDPDGEQMQIYITDGYYEVGEGVILITHST